MDRKLSSQDKFNIQQNFRRYLKFQDHYDGANDVVKAAKASRIWIIGVIALFFALSSEFFLGVSAALFCVYFYRIVSASIELGDANEGKEDTQRWFATQGFKLEGRVLYFMDDSMLDNPIDPFDERIYQ